ncbi:MAG TPA: ABC transporter ATP-binding protein [Trueperaceae bacterium]|nr:ABC transporter ATP-binding protein [Trueperaceae bacterium]
MSGLLEVKGGAYTLPTGRVLFSGIDLGLRAGEILCVLGPNGVGKTTLIHCVTGLKRWAAGATYLAGRSQASYSPREFWSKVGFVPQARANVFAYSVLEMVLLGLSTRVGEFGVPSAAQRAQALAVLERLEIAHLARRSCNELSGGELQLVFIGRALVNEPELLILDEPESHLDFKKQLIILDLVRRLAVEDGIACIMNTHFPNNAMRVATQILLLGGGARYLVGDAASVLTRANVAEYFEVDARIVTVATDAGTWPALYPVSVIGDRGTTIGKDS